MQEKSILEKKNEVADAMESVLVSTVKNLLKNSLKRELTQREAENILANIGMRVYLRNLNSKNNES